MTATDAVSQRSRLTAIHLGLLFALIYFVQGLAEPGEGLIAQPVRSLLRDWKHSPGEIAHFMALVSMPWAIKPIYGLIIDFVPLLGSRRRKYLLLATMATSLSLIWLAFSVPAQGATLTLLTLLIIPTFAVAFSDVVVDALMVEKGQQLGMTGRLQSIQWASMYTATLFAGSLGGWMSQHDRQDLGFLICGIGAAASFIATWFWIHDAPIGEAVVPDVTPGTADSGPNSKAHSERSDSVRFRLAIMWQTLSNRQFLVAAVFLFLWNFNPFSSTIQHLHMTEQLRLTDQQYGHTNSLFSVGSVGACLVYGLLCRTIPGRWLIHIAITGGVLSTLTYLMAEGVQSTFIISVFVGFVYMLGNLIQMDIAARMCPPDIAGSMFAFLMSVSNIAIILSTSLGGWLFEIIAGASDPLVAYSVLIWIGTGTTAMCWILAPWFRGSAVVDQCR